MVKEGGHLHGGPLEVKAGLTRGCSRRKDLIQGSEVQLRVFDSEPSHLLYWGGVWDWVQVWSMGVSLALGKY